MTTLPLLALAGYFLILAEFIAMRHRDICAESDDAIYREFLIDACQRRATQESMKLYWNRGTK